MSARTSPVGDELAGRFDDVRPLRSRPPFVLFEARERPGGRRVVVKVPDGVRHLWVDGLLRTQATLLGRIGSHPHVIGVLDSFTLDDGRPALVLEHATGSPRDAVTAAPEPLRAAIATGIKLAGALETVHAADALHCDVRPDNVFTTDVGEPVLGGFDEAVSTAPDASRFPQHVITAYTAPELLEGAAPSPATDVYGLAATLYELVAGHAAFREYAGESAATVIVRVLGGQVQPIVAPDVPIEVSDLLTWAMSADATKRPPTPAWFAEELARIELRQGWPRTHLVTG
ncbi:Protein kinase domain-containing protein [Jatrophihabitans endophyticus]|uniref:non-specific serine/threonine protein kinase n=2 Tax=Jatrophihabitans endophyticus TaxID=1206085 RepID=A0A1M5PAY3_9ACTN|nr:Protein kinase domain-containing protein [Jatrophihabitans endophyticus]